MSMAMRMVAVPRRPAPGVLDYRDRRARGVGRPARLSSAAMSSPAGTSRAPGPYGPPRHSAWTGVDWRAHRRFVEIDGLRVNVVEIGSPRPAAAVFPRRPPPSASTLPRKHPPPPPP